MQSRQDAERIFTKVLQSVNPLVIVKEYAEKVRSYYEMKGFSRLVVTGFGKASYPMAMAVEEVFGDLIHEGAVITKYGHAQSREAAMGGKQSGGLHTIRVFEAAHPVPDEKGIAATREIVRMIEDLDSQTLVLCLVSGGGSALFVSPCEPVTLQEKQDITDLLLKAGADITELNAVRKHLSMVKGGRFAECAAPAEVISLMISDVIGDSLDVIASGPTAPDRSTFQDALDVIARYGLRDRAPASVIRVLDQGAAGSVQDTPGEDNPQFRRVQNIIIGSNRKAVEAAKAEAEVLGYQAEILSWKLSGEAKERGRWLAGKALDRQSSHLVRTGRSGKQTESDGPFCLISGGETTVKVQGSGKGGRNTEFALSFAMEIDGAQGITLLSAGTDGTDGPTDAAGAVVDGSTLSQARDKGLDSTVYLENNDSYTFFKELDSLLITGPTGTNVMDVQIVLIEKE